MGRGRAPCCEKIGLNRGAWTPEEDMRLIAYITKYGHGNWRALPKKAGLLRCGKSCRLRWINYLRPDIKRGNFSAEEEDTIIKLHNSLGNKWSKIASSLPGRTDNEIKNVWNTHLKKRVNSTALDTPSSSSSETTSISIEHKCSQPDLPDYFDAWSLPDVDINDSLDEILEIDIENDAGVTEDSDSWVRSSDTDWKFWGCTGRVHEDFRVQSTEYSPGTPRELQSAPNPLIPQSAPKILATEEGEAKERRRWLTYLEEELGLFEGQGGEDDEKMVDMDPVRSYFQKTESSPSTL